MLIRLAVYILVVKEEAMNPYSAAVCEHMKVFYDSLSEKDRRRYASVFARRRLDDLGASASEDTEAASAAAGQ